jgi:3,4-dihydroxy 2-butanone 4-phosphate synthase/GTP cyclohydrolase II
MAYIVDPTGNLMTDTLPVSRLECARIPTEVGEFQLCLYSNTNDDKEHLALTMGEVEDQEAVLVRVHSECFTGDVIGSQRCDCGEQLSLAKELIAGAGQGVIIYLRQEGRGIGLLDKLRAYNLQDQGLDTVEANLELGHQADEREYSAAAHILKSLGVRSIRLMTNNPDKVDSLRNLGIDIVDRVPLEASVNQHNAQYLKTKVTRLNHALSIGSLIEDPHDGNGNGSSRL